jgi:hypothetical protein
MLKTAKEAELELDEGLRYEIGKKLSGKKRTHHELQDGIDLGMFKEWKGEAAIKERNKAVQRSNALKLQYQADKKREITRKFSNSSYLTPESIMYLNDAVKKQASKVDEELVYAGLHSENIAKKSFKKTEKNKQRFKGRRKGSKHKTANRRA